MSRPTGATALLGVTSVAALAAGVHAAPALTTFGPMRHRVLPRLSGIGRPDHIALTFDDGPDEASTPQFLDVLAAADVRATFFVLGEMLERAPELGRRMVEAGHELAVHGWTHRNLLLRGPVATRRELRRTIALIEDVTGTSPRFYRPPYGVLSSGALAAARATGLQPVLWTGWGEDWSASATPSSVLRTLEPDLSGGATLLLHDSDCTSAPQAWRSALGALPPLLERCRAAGWTVGPLAEHGLFTAGLPHARSG
jgi:peptidoglycan/xylan/chitin deacetylase (PgdA/CDA1 family)